MAIEMCLVWFFFTHKKNLKKGRLLEKSGNPIKNEKLVEIQYMYECKYVILLIFNVI